MTIKDFGGFLSSGLSADGFPVRPDGWILIHVDTGDTYNRRSGQWQQLGLGLSFAPPTKSGLVQTDENGIADITFATPFVDDLYTVALTCGDEGGLPNVALVSSRLATGFSIITRSTQSGQPTEQVTVSWLATRNYNA